MENVNLILFICIAGPILPVLLLLKEEKSRLFLSLLLIGTIICLFASSVNFLILSLYEGDLLYVTTNITPITEEILKGLPVLYFAWFVTDDRDTLLSVSVAVGLGFALFENLIILMENVSSVTILWALTRGIGASLMHSTCTFLVAMGISMIRKRRKLFICGTFSLLITAALYHAIFNTLVQSDYRLYQRIEDRMV